MSDYMIDLCKLSNSIKYSNYFPDKSQDIFHYTSPWAFKSIIENKKLRFSDRYYLNDSSEGKVIMELCKNEIDTVAPEDETFKRCLLEECCKRYEVPQRDNFYVFQCSFSLDNDSLCLWNYYTKGDCVRGYNLHFKSGELKRKILMKSKMDDGRTPKIIASKIVYNRKKQIKIVKNVIQQFYDFSVGYNHCDKQFTVGILVDKLMLLGAFFKKECFQVEKEYRFVIDLYLDDDGTYGAIKENQEFYEKDGIFMPYVDLDFSSDALKAISMSPSLDFERTKESIRRLTQKNFPQFRDSDLIKQSNIPLRY